jgi:hypothetical protein
MTSPEQYGPVLDAVGVGNALTVTEVLAEAVQLPTETVTS